MIERMAGECIRSLGRVQMKMLESFGAWKTVVHCRAHLNGTTAKSLKSH